MLEIRRLGREAPGPRDPFDGDKRGTMVSVADQGPQELEVGVKVPFEVLGKGAQIGCRAGPRRWNQLTFV